MKALKFLVAMFLLFVVIVLGTANNVSVPLNIWIDTPLLGYKTVEVAKTPDETAPNGIAIVPQPRQATLWIVILVFFTLGFLVAYFWTFQDAFRFRREAKRLRKQVASLTQAQEAASTQEVAPVEETGSEPVSA